MGDVVYGSLRDPKLLSNRPLALTANQSPDRKNFMLCQFCGAAALASLVSIVKQLIGVVPRYRVPAKMLGVHANPVAATVGCLHIAAQRKPVCLFAHQPVRPALHPIGNHEAVAIGVYAKRPHKALFAIMFDMIL